MDELYKTSLLHKIIELTDKHVLEELVCKARSMCHLLSDPALQTKESEKVLEMFLQSEDQDILLLQCINGTTLPNKSWDAVSPSINVCYFLKKCSVSTSCGSIEEVLTHGVLERNNAVTMLEEFLKKKQEMVANMQFSPYIRHQVLQSLDIARAQIRGPEDFRILLPVDDLCEVDEGSEDYRLRRLEWYVRHWIIKIVDLKASLAQNNSDQLSGLRGEIQLIRQKEKQWSELVTQLNSEDVQKTTLLLGAGQSIYIRHLQDYQTLVKKELDQTNCAILTLEPCLRWIEEIENAKLNDLPTIVKSVSEDLLRQCSKDRNLSDSIEVTNIIHQSAFDILNEASTFLNIEKLFQGHVEEVLRQSEAQKTFISNVVGEITKVIGAKADLDPKLSSIYFVDYLIRLGHVTEIAYCQQQFGRKSYGTKFIQEEADSEVAEDFVTIEAEYNITIKKLEVHKNEILDINKDDWHVYYREFSFAVKNLEILVTNVLERTLEKQLNFQELNSALAFYKRFFSRHRVKVAMLKSVRKVYDMAENEVQEILKAAEDGEFYQRDEDLGQYVSEETRHAFVVKSAINQIEHILKVIDSLSWLPCGSKNDQVQTLCTTSIARLRSIIDQLFNDWLIRLAESLSDGVCGNMFRFNKRKSTDAVITKGLLLLLNSPVMCRFVGNPLLLQTALDKMVLEVLHSCGWWEHLGVYLPLDLKRFWERKDIVLSLWEKVEKLVLAYNDAVKEMGSEERQLFRAELKQVNTLVELGLSTVVWNQPLGVNNLYNKLNSHIIILEDRVKVYKLLNKTVQECCSKMETTRLFSFPDKSTEFSAVKMMVEEEPGKLAESELMPLLTRTLEDLKGFQLTVDLTSSQAIRQWHETAKYFESKLVAAFQCVANETARSIEEHLEKPSSPFLLFILEFRDKKVEIAPDLLEAEEIFDVLKNSIENAIKPGLEAIAALRPTAGNNPEVWLNNINQSIYILDRYKSMRHLLRDSYKKAKKYTDRWKVWKQFVGPNLDLFSDIYAPPEDQFLQDIKQFVSIRKAALEHQEFITVSFIQVDFRQLR
ncbi:hypothetical protein QYM36_001715, partial [Artemia franciscana]